MGISPHLFILLRARSAGARPTFRHGLKAGCGRGNASPGNDPWQKQNAPPVGAGRARKVVQTIEKWHFLPTGAAPTRPEIDEHDLTAIFLEPQIVTAETLQRKIRSLVPNSYRLRLAHEYNREKRNQQPT